MPSKVSFFVLDEHVLLVNCLNALDPQATIWARPTVTMAQRIYVVLADDPVTGTIYPKVLKGLVWLRNQGRINEDYTMSNADVADLLGGTHPGEPIIYN